MVNNFQTQEDLKKLEFAHIFRHKWIECGGLVTKSIAAELLGSTQPWINQLIQKGKLTEIKILDKTFLSYQEVYILQQRANKKRAINILKKEARENNIPIKSLKATFEDIENSIF